MRTRPPTQPIAGQRRHQPRHVTPHWIDHVTTIIGITMIGIVILITAYGGTTTPPVGHVTTTSTTGRP